MRTIVSLLVFAIGAVAALAQGQVDFRNGGVTFAGQSGIDRRVYGPDGCPLVGTNWAAGLYYMAGADAPIDGAILGTQAGALATFRVATTASPGLWLNPTAVGNSRVLDGVPIGATATIQIRVWDSAQFSSFALAHAAGQFGASCPFNYTVPAAGSPPDAYYLTAFRGIGGSPFVPCVPEPSTVLIVGLGTVSLIAFRRRRN